MDQNYLDKMGCEIPPMESLITLMEIEQSMPFQDSALWELIKNYYIHLVWERNLAKKCCAMLHNEQLEVIIEYQNIHWHSQWIF